MKIFDKDLKNFTEDKSLKKCLKVSALTFFTYFLVGVIVKGYYYGRL